MCGQTLPDMWAELVMAVEDSQPQHAEYIAEFALEVRDDFDDMFSPFDMWGQSESTCWMIYAEFERAAAREYKALHTARAEEYDKAACAARAQYLRLFREGYTC